MIVANTPDVAFAGQQTGTQARLPQQTLDQQDFLQLLVAQMTSQDPLNPKSDIEMIPQMVQFSTLAQSQAMQADIAQLRSQQESLRANMLLGLTVQLKVDDHTQVVGQVSAVQMVEGTPELVVNGRAYGLDQVISIMPPPAVVPSGSSSSAGPYSNTTPQSNPS